MTNENGLKCPCVTQWLTGGPLWIFGDCINIPSPEVKRFIITQREIKKIRVAFCSISINRSTLCTSRHYVFDNQLSVYVCVCPEWNLLIWLMCIGGVTDHVTRTFGSNCPIPSHPISSWWWSSRHTLYLSPLPILSQIIIFLCVVIRKTWPRETTTAITGTHLLLLSSLSLYINNN